MELKTKPSELSECDIEFIIENYDRLSTTELAKGVGGDEELIYKTAFKIRKMSKGELCKSKRTQSNITKALIRRGLI